MKEEKNYNDILIVSNDSDFIDLIEESFNNHISTKTALSLNVGAEKIEKNQLDCIIADSTVYPQKDVFENIRNLIEEIRFFVFIEEGEEEILEKENLDIITDWFYKGKDSGIKYRVDFLKERIESETNPDKLDKLHRKDRKKKELLKKTVDGLRDVLYLFDSKGNFLFWNDTVREKTGYTDSEIADMKPTDFFSGKDKERIAKSIERILKTGKSEGIEAAVVTKDGEKIPHEFRSRLLKDSKGNPIGICGVGREISKRKYRVKQLKALNNATASFFSLENKEEIVEKSLNIAEEVLNLSYIFIYLIDTKKGILKPVKYSEKAKEKIGKPPKFTGGDSLTWKTYIQSETKVYKDISSAEETYDFEIPIKSSVLIPIGDHGVFIAASTKSQELDDVNIEFAETLVSNLKSAIDRAKREEKLKEREKELKTKNQRLEHLNRVNDVLRSIAQTVVQSSSVDEIEKSVCNYLSKIDLYEFVWIGKKNPVNGRIKPQFQAGTEEKYLESIEVTTKNSEKPKCVSVSEDEVTVVENILEQRSSDTWQEEALKRGYRSVITIPISHDDLKYGALQIYANEIDAFDKNLQLLLEELGQLIAHGIYSIRREKALLSEDAIELELNINNKNGFFQKLARNTEGKINIQSIINQDGNSNLIFFKVEDSAPEDVLNFANDSVDIIDIEKLKNREKGTLFECNIKGSTIPTTIAKLGGSPKFVLADKNKTKVIVEIPQKENIEIFIQELSDHFSKVNLAAKRLKSKSKNGEPLKRKLEDSLTERQWEILEAAYFGGLFDWPKKSSGEELADSLDISPPTFHQHLKSGEKNLLSKIFE